MTQVWRDMQGVNTHQSCSDARYLNMAVHIALHYDLVAHIQSIRCRYTIEGDTIETKFFGNPDETFDWLHDKILEELEKNQKALNDSQ